MLDLERLDRIQFNSRPRFQEVVANAFLLPNYGLFPGVKIEFEDVHLVPDEPVIFAMNHTDRFNYWPFQYLLFRRHKRYTATWVKGKYYEDAMVGAFMEAANNIPAVSRGYLIAKDFLLTLGRKPEKAEYDALRAMVNAAARGTVSELDVEIDKALFETPRNILGRHFRPEDEDYAHAMEELYREMMRRFVSLNREAARLGLDILIFPQGTRSKRLSKGRIGLAQIAMSLERPVVPVGCNGSDRVYPGSSPVAKRGRIVYRFGEALRREDAAAWVDKSKFDPFTAEAEEFETDFQRYTDDLMNRIESLLDEEYRFSRDQESGGVQGTDRFL